MLLTTTVLALSLLGTPQKTCTAPTQTGIFRITALTKDSISAKIGMVLLESVDNCLEASILTDDAGPAVIDQLQVNGNELTGRVRLPSGMAKVTFRVSGSTIAGSIVEGKHEWAVSGRRTSGDTRMAAGDVIR